MLCDLYKIDCTISTKHDLGELARFLCELSVCDYFFVTKKPSSIAIAALHTAIDHIDYNRLTPRARSLIYEAIRSMTQLDASSDEVSLCRSRLNEMYRQGSYGRNVEDNNARRGPSPNFVGDVQDDGNMNPKYVTP